MNHLGKSSDVTFHGDILMQEEANEIQIRPPEKVHLLHSSIRAPKNTPAPWWQMGEADEHHPARFPYLAYLKISCGTSVPSII